MEVPLFFQMKTDVLRSKWTCPRYVLPLKFESVHPIPNHMFFFSSSQGLTWGIVFWSSLFLDDLGVLRFSCRSFIGRAQKMNISNLETVI